MTQEYGCDYAASNLNDMRRFYEDFQILQALPAESSETKIFQPLAGKSTNAPILQAVFVELPDQSSRSQIDQTPSSEFLPHQILQTTSGESSSEAIWQAVPAKSSEEKSEGARLPLHR
jgi:hypothetical protein